jgi:predicted NAD/FAD-dependent oxidoreductase
MPLRDERRYVVRNSQGRFVETFEVKSSGAGSRLASSRSSSAQERADYSKQVVQDGREVARYVIEKRTGKRA